MTTTIPGSTGSCSTSSISSPPSILPSPWRRDEYWPRCSRGTGGTCYGLAWSLLHLIEALGADGLGAVVTGVDSAQWREMFEQRLENAEDPRRRRDDGRL